MAANHLRGAVVVVAIGALLVSACSPAEPSPERQQSSDASGPPANGRGETFHDPIREAIARLAWATGVRYKGTITDRLDHEVDLAVGVTAEGLGSGSVRTAAGKAEVLLTPGQVHLRGKARFWKEFPFAIGQADNLVGDLRERDAARYADDLGGLAIDAIADELAGRWVTVDPADLGMPSAGLLTPPPFADEAALVLARSGAGVATTVGETRAVKYQTEGTWTYYVTTATPASFVRVESATVDLEARLDITRLNAARAQQVRDDVQFHADGLSDGYDLRIGLAAVPKDHIDVTCSASGCTGKVKLRANGKAAPTKGGVFMMVGAGPTGRLGRCKSGFGAFDRGDRKRASCTLSNNAVHDWYTSTSEQSWFGSLQLARSTIARTDLAAAVTTPAALPPLERQHLAADAVEAWEKITGAPARGGGCEIYLRVPADWVHLGAGDPLGAANLIAVHPDAYATTIAVQWDNRRVFSLLVTPQARDVEMWAANTDRRHGALVRTPVPGRTPTCTNR